MTASEAPPARIAGARVARTRSDLTLLATGGMLLALSALVLDAHSVSDLEESAFRLVNDHTVVPFVLIWAVMQLGNVLAVPILAAAAAATKRWRLAAGIVIGGLATYLLARVVKGVAERGRPAALLDEVHIRGAAAAGRGYVSGHAALAALFAALAWPYLGRRGRIAVVLIAGVVALARVYVGAHLPLDIIGGAGLGLAVAGAIRLLLGRPVPAPERTDPAPGSRR